ncbi:transcriptional regulator, LysR family [Pseudogulbenkiania sp. NH8B]|uniref:LysR family transcriptional regulator n=1 Tax=Pseudogulbenkiania sp. (strain NH8B) TaxID=748280 RepID=UPI000227A2B8|nr:LysR family transcriptional regulator [Pseudogulbenkiania sp. NH8B]BAK78081.1 transcriptional regulator, LysR family [Pseudogulbenkiania sp. NH8B]
MELRHLRYFIAIAEEQNFTRAAERLGIQQPPLSQQIRQLEQELGTPLFRRLTRKVELTEAGASFLSDARAILEQVERAKNSVQRFSRGEAGRIRIGFAGATYFQPEVTALIRDYRARYPGVQLLPEQSNTALLVEGLRSGEIDVAFVRPPIGGADGLNTQLLVEEDMLVALPAAHRLSRQAALPLSALAEETFILFPRAISPGLYDNLISAFHQAGFSPRLGQEAPQIASIVPMIDAGFGISLVPRSVSQIRTEGVRYVPITAPVPAAPIGIAYRQDQHSVALAHFVALAREKRQHAPARPE